MKNWQISIAVFLLIIAFQKSHSQAITGNTIIPKFENFTGTVYSMPVVTRKNGRSISKRIIEHYHDSLSQYPRIGDIMLESIDIPETSIVSGSFPQVDRKTQFCMILNSKMIIEVEGCYEFSLNSDDGSILWINDVESLNNDGGHQMRLKKDSIPLTAGIYDIRLWYFQGLPDRFGFEFDSKLVSPELSCGNQLIVKELDIANDILFETGKYILDSSAISELGRMIETVELEKVHLIEIIGHTDNVGSEESNKILSEQRAHEIRKILLNLIDEKDIAIMSTGKGELEPRASNQSPEGRRENRRVQIVFKSR